MVKKLFALASVSALAGLVSAVSAAGCSYDRDGHAGAGDRRLVGGDAEKDRRQAGPTPVTTRKSEDVTCAQKDGRSRRRSRTRRPRLGRRRVHRRQSRRRSSSSWTTRSRPRSSTSSSRSGPPTSARGCAACVFTKADDASWGVIITKADDPEPSSRTTAAVASRSRAATRNVAAPTSSSRQCASSRAVRPARRRKTSTRA